MDNQHKLIKGYRDLSAEEIQSMNDVKAVGQQIGDTLAKLEGLPDIDKRWLAIGRTNLQQGIMAVVRAIAKPTSF